MHSDELKKGIARAPARAMLKGAGFTDADLERPLVGIANTWTEVTPCNVHLRELAEAVKEGVRAAGGTPIEFNTIAVSDGITMGTEGMRASLVSREVIADSIELVRDGAPARRRGRAVGLRQDDPRHGDGARAARSCPALMLYGGPIAPGAFEGRDVTIQDVFEAVGAHAAGRMTASGSTVLEDHACPGRRRVRRPVHREHDVGRDHAARPVADGRERGRRRPTRTSATRRGACGALVMQMIAPGPAAQRSSSRATAFDNAIASVGGDGRLDERGAPPARDRARGRRPARDRRLRHHRRADAGAVAISSRAGGSRRST